MSDPRRCSVCGVILTRLRVRVARPARLGLPARWRIENVCSARCEVREGNP